MQKQDRVAAEQSRTRAYAQYHDTVQNSTE